MILGSCFLHGTFLLILHLNGKDLNVAGGTGVEEDTVATMAVDRVRMCILTKPVAAVLAQWYPLQPAAIPVRHNTRDVFAILFMWVRTIVGAVVPNLLHLVRELEISVAA